MISETVHDGDWPADRLFEFSSVVAPPGTSGCPAGRHFLSGSNGSGFLSIADLLLQTDFPPCGACPTTNIFSSVPSGPAYYIGNDNVMARLPNGALLLVRLVRTVTDPLDPSSTSGDFDRVGALIWASTDCGATWNIRSFIDSADTANFPPPNWDGVDLGYGQMQPDHKNGGLTRGGWDREEIYVDPWSGDVFITMNGEGGVDSAGNEKYHNALLFRSKDGGMTWKMTPVSSDHITPLMMTSVGGLGYPSTLFLFNAGKHPTLRWSFDGGATISEKFTVSDYTVGQVQWGGGLQIQGCESVTRIGRHQGVVSAYDTVRITWPSVLNNKQVLRVASVTIGIDSSPFSPITPPQFKDLKTIGRPDGDVLHSSIIEADLSLAELDSGENTALIFWIERVFNLNQIRGIVVRDENGWSDEFYISQAAWTENGATGHYIKGGFYVNNSSLSPLRFLAPWIQTDTSPRTLRTKLLGVSR